MRVGACEGFAHNSVKLVLLANGDRLEVDFSTFFLSGKALYPFKILPCPNSELFWHTFISVVCDYESYSAVNCFLSVVQVEQCSINSDLQAPS